MASRRTSSFEHAAGELLPIARAQAGISKRRADLDRPCRVAPLEPCVTRHACRRGWYPERDPLDSAPSSDDPARDRSAADRETGHNSKRSTAIMPLQAWTRPE